jgi:hypothetical protein
MGMYVSLHLNGDEKIDAVTEIHKRTTIRDMNRRNEFAVFKLSSPEGNIDIYTEKLSDLETMAFHLNALIRELRDDHNWTE